MNKFSQWVILRNEAQWQQYREEFEKSFRDNPAHKTTPVEFPTEPKSYPCLVAALPDLADITQAGTWAQADVRCCFVYPKDAEGLLRVADKKQADRYASMRDAEDDDDDDYLDDDFGPSEIGTLVLALTLELRSLGAIKSDRLISTSHKVREWLEDNIEENLEDDDTISILQKLWKAHDAG